MTKIILTLTAVALLSSAGFAQIYVDKAATGGTYDGITWATAYQDLQPALDAAAANDQIWVAQGTYLPTAEPDGAPIGNNQYYAFHIANKDIKIYGGFAGTETMLNQRDWQSNPTILSGDFNGDDVVNGSGSSLSITNNSENANNVFVTVGLTTSFELDGFSITGGVGRNVATAYTYSTQSISPWTGGGMNNYTSPTITNVTFSGNKAYVGGAMFSSPSSSPSITNVTFSRNYSDYGGAMYTGLSSATFTNVTFSGNYAVTYGGGVYDYDPSLTFTNVTFSGNYASEGGAMYNVNPGTITIKNTLFYGNTSDINNVNFAGTFNISYSLTQTAPSAGFGTLNASNNLTPGTTDPLFVNSTTPAGADGIWMTADDGLALQVTSPCLGTGTTTGAPTTDITGQTRPATPSIGAYEKGCVATTGTDVQTACDTYDWIDGNTYTASNNSATWTLTNAAGCDSVVTLDLTINPMPDVNVTQSWLLLTADQTGATYQWLDCDDNNNTIGGETNQAYTPTPIIGNYAVEIDLNGCIDTSACYLVDYTGLSDLYKDKLSLSPNPADEQIVITGLDEVTGLQGIEVISSSGKLEIKVDGQATQLNVSELVSGVYFVRVVHEQGIETLRFIKK